MGPFTRQLYEFAAEDPSLGKPVFYSRSSLVAPEEVIVQLTFGSKFFLSRSSHKKLISAQEDAAEVAVDEVTRMVSAKRKGQRRLSDVRLQIRPSAEALSGMVGARNDEGSLAGEPPTQALTRESPSIPSQVPSPVPMPANLSDQVPLPRAPAHIPPKVPIKGKRRAPKATTAMDSSEIRMLKREEEPAWEWLNEETWT